MSGDSNTTISFSEAIVVVLKSHTASIQTALKPHKINIKLSFSEIPDDSDMGTADSLRSISDKLSVSLKRRSG